ncbi:MAG: hypothetical protein AAB113_02545 [Candidatus Eisenbacteria bacterium]
MRDRTARRGGWTRWVAGGVGLALLLAGCAATRPAPPVAAPGAPLPRVALLPLEDLSGRVDAGDIFTRILFVELVRTGACEVVESGIVEAAAETLHIRSTGSLARDDLHALGERLGVRYVMLGSLLESAAVKTAEGEVPSVGVTLKLLDAASARVVWAAVRFRSGEDRETVFGWGRRRDRAKLAAELAAEILKDFRIPVAVSMADTAAAPRSGGAR